MVQYNCFRCGYVTNYKKDMRVHLNRQKKCKPVIRDINLNHYGHAILNRQEFINTDGCSILLHSAPSLLHSAPFCSTLQYRCEFCDRKYTYNRNLTKHLKLCFAKKEQEEANARTYALVDTLNKQIEEQEKRIDILEQTKEPHSPVTTNNTMNNNVQVVINVDQNRLNYKDTNYEILEDQEIKNALSHAASCLQEIVPITHFNKKHPENQNIYISCLKSAVAMMFEDERWNAHMWSDIADRVIDDNTVTLQDWMNRHKENYPRLEERFKIFMDKKEGDDDVFLTKLKRDLKLILYNNRKLIHSEEMIKLLQETIL